MDRKTQRLVAAYLARRRTRGTAADVGHKLKAKVTASNAAGSVTATTSNASAKVTS